MSGDSIWAARADGSARRLLISPAGPHEVISQPVWSHDGSMLAYVSGVEPRGQRGTGVGAARVMVFDGTSSRALTPRREGTWAPPQPGLYLLRLRVPVARAANGFDYVMHVVDGHVRG